MQFEGINLGWCGRFDLEFMKKAAIRWDELHDGVVNLLAAEAYRKREIRQARDEDDEENYK